MNRPDSIAAIQNSFASIVAQVFVRHLPEPAQYMPAIVFSLLKVAGATERNGARMTKEFPLPQRSLYGRPRTCADDGFDRSKITVDEIKSYCDKLRDFGHQFPLSKIRKNLTVKPASSR
jgi:hypothetical protein